MHETGIVTTTDANRRGRHPSGPISGNSVQRTEAAPEAVRLSDGHRAKAESMSADPGAEAVYRKQLRPVITEGAEAMDVIFAQRREATACEA
ncbi:hypothetical protein [Streptomyces sp. NPDC020362]|uniref:hypothetical protein n=1 Tax=unclassified Streptomyces TaxID=2593676 RepID=UPI0033DC84F5